MGDIKKIKSLLREAPRRIAIITHTNPDGDAIGSSLGLYNILVNAGHVADVITPNAYPSFLHWLPGNDKVIICSENKEAALKKIMKAEIIFSIDFNELKRIKQFHKPVEDSGAYKVMIDHHPKPESFADFTMNDVSVSSTAELVYIFTTSLGLKKYINTEAAICLFTGIMADTGCFSYNSSNKNTYLIIADLLEYKFSKDEIYYNLYDNFTVNRMRLLGYALNKKLEILPEYNTAIISLTGKELENYKFQTGDTEGFVNYPLSIKNICFSAFFTEREDHIKISFRSKGDFAVNEFSEKHFNGGGHLNAAGGESYTTMEKTIEKFKKLLPEYKHNLQKYAN
jgi:phosphoesterase RecJ-like protein